MTIDLLKTRHPFLNDKPKRMLIDGKWVEAASGKTFESINPSTGEVLATVAEGDAEDIDRAVAAARRAFNGPWSKFKPAERQALLLKLADIVEQNFDELASLDTLDMGGPIKRTLGGRSRVVGLLRYYAGQAIAIHGETIENSLPGSYVSFTLKEPVGVVGGIIPGTVRWDWRVGRSVAPWRPAARWCSSRQSRRRCQRFAWPNSAWRPVFHRVSSMWFPAMVRPPVRLSPPIWMWTRWRLPVRISPDRRSSRLRPATSSACNSNSAASRPTWCSPTPISMPPCPARRWRCSTTPDRFAVQERGCLSSARSTRNSPAASRNSARNCASATAPIPRRRSGLWFRLNSSSGSLDICRSAARKVPARAGAAGLSANRITLLRDADGDGVAEIQEVFLEGLNQPFGMAMLDDTFYVGNTDGVVAFPYTTGATPHHRTRDAQLATFKPGGHWTRSLLPSPDGRSSTSASARPATSPRTAWKTKKAVPSSTSSISRAARAAPSRRSAQRRGHGVGAADRRALDGGQ